MTTLIEAAKAVLNASARNHLRKHHLDALRQAVQAEQDVPVYTPLTEEEIFKLADSWLENNNPSKIGWATTLERAVIERLGLRWPE